MLSIKNIYLYLVFGNTLAASLIWGINTIFLLNAGLSNFEAFLANGFFTLGQVLFEVPTGIVADTFGRRTSYLLGAFTLTVSTLLYLFNWKIEGPFWLWILSSVLLGLGFAFFSGALEAWLVDALKAKNSHESMDSIFAHGQTVGGVAMLMGAVGGGVIAQFSNLGVPYIVRAVILVFNFATAFFLMKDLGFTPTSAKRPIKEMKRILKDSVTYGLKNPPVRWIMLAAPFTMGVTFYVFYALQPYLLQLYGNEQAYWIAGLVAAVTASAQIVGGIFSNRIKNIFKKRTTALIAMTLVAGSTMLLFSIVNIFWLALVIIFISFFVFTASVPIRQIYLNASIPSEQRATVLSFDSLMGSSGGMIMQPSLGKAADVWGYPVSFALSSIFPIMAIPFLFFAKKTNAPSDVIK